MKNFYIISQRMNVTVDDVTKMPYVKYLFWVSFFKEYDREQEMEARKNKRK